MITIPELAAEALGSHLAAHMGRRFGSTDAGLVEIVQSAARLALDCIGNSDALYHNVEHTMLATFVGYDILKRPKALKRNECRRLCPGPGRLSVSRHRLCSWHPTRRR